MSTLSALISSGGGDKLTATTATAGDNITAGKSYKIGVDGKAYSASTVLNAAGSSYTTALTNTLGGTPTDAMYFPDARHSIWLPNGNIVSLFWNAGSQIVAAYINGTTFLEIAEANVEWSFIPNQQAAGALYYIGKYTYSSVDYYLIGFSISYYQNNGAVYRVRMGTLRINTAGSGSVDDIRSLTNLAGNSGMVPNGYASTYAGSNSGGTNFLTCRGGRYILFQHANNSATEWRVVNAYSGSNTGFAAIPDTSQQGSGTTLSTGSGYGTYTHKVDDANGKFLLFYINSGGNGTDVKLLTVDANGAITLSASNLTETSWSSGQSQEYMSAWIQITTTTFAQVYARNSYWQIRTFTYDGNTTVTQTGSSGNVYEAGIDSTYGLNRMNQARAQYVASGDKLYMWDADDDSTTWQFDLTNRTIKSITPSFNALNGSYHTTSVFANVQPDGSFLVGTYYNEPSAGVGKWGRFAARHFDPDFVQTVHSPLIATADASAGATANFMLKPGISSDTVLSTSYYIAKEGMYYPLNTSGAIGDGATGTSDQRSATTLDNIRHD